MLPEIITFGIFFGIFVFGIWSAVKKVQKKDFLIEETMELNQLYEEEVENLSKEKKKYQKTREELAFFLKNFRECAEVIKGEEIKIIDNNHLTCEPYTPPMLFSIFAIKKGAKIKVLNKPVVIRQGKRCYRCVYIDNEDRYQTEDDYIEPTKKVREITHKTKFFVFEHEIVKLKTFQFILSQKMKHDEINMDKIFGYTQ